MTIVVNTHSEIEEKELIAFLKQKKYDYAKEEIPLSDEQLSELLERDGAFEAGKAESFSLDEIKAYFNVLKWARNDMEKSAKWYDKKQPGLGERFLREVVIAMEHVNANPLHYEIRHSKLFRFARVTDFPFLIAFKIKGDTIIVQAVFHTSRNPKRFI